MPASLTSPLLSAPASSELAAPSEASSEEEGGETARHESGAWGAVCTLANCAVGAGVLGLPWVFSCLGVAGGAALCAVAALLEGRTLAMLVACGRAYGAATYQDLVAKSLGKTASAVTSSVIVLYLFGSCASYLIIVGDCLPSALAPLLELCGVAKHHALVPRNAAIAAASALVSLPLSFADTLAALERASALTPIVLAALAACTTVLAVHAVQDAGPGLPEHAKWLLWGAGADRQPAAAVPRVVFAYQAHIPVISVVAGMRKDARFFGAGGGGAEVPSARVPLTVASTVCVVAMALCCFAYSAVGAAGYLADPDTTGNYLVSLRDMPGASWASKVCNAAIVVVALTSYPVNYLPARDALESLAGLDAGRSRPGRRVRRLGMALAWFVACLCTSLAVRDLGTAFELIGGTAGTAVIFVVPALVQLHRLRFRFSVRSAECLFLLAASSAIAASTVLSL